MVSLPWASISCACSYLLLVGGFVNGYGAAVLATSGCVFLLSMTTRLLWKKEKLAMIQPYQFILLLGVFWCLMYLQPKGEAWNMPGLWVLTVSLKVSFCIGGLFARFDGTFVSRKPYAPFLLLVALWGVASLVCAFFALTGAPMFFYLACAFLIAANSQYLTKNKAGEAVGGGEGRKRWLNATKKWMLFIGITVFTVMMGLEKNHGLAISRDIYGHVWLVSSAALLFITNPFLEDHKTIIIIAWVALQTLGVVLSVL